MNEPMCDFSKVKELQEYLIEDGDVDYAILHLAVALAGLVDSPTEMDAISNWAYRIARQHEGMEDNVLQFKELH